jgi:uncharacterized protein (DUF1697 family)
MEPLRAALVKLGLTEVGSFGASGNFVFRAPSSDVALLEQRIFEAVGAEAFVRSREELLAIVANDPYAGRQGAGLFLSRRPVDEASDVFRDAFGPEGDPPVASGTTVYFMNPTRLPGRKAVIDFERELGVRGTMRASRVVARVLDMM